MEINGFKIDKFNVYNIPENVKAWTCPECSHLRKVQNQKQKCLSVHWDTGIGVCNHCGAWVQLHTYDKKKDVKTYNRPKWENNTNLSEKIVKWFEGRGISQFTLRRLQVSEGVDGMPIKGGKFENRNTIHFNFFRSGELINIKYRDGEKNFKLVSGAEKIFYNLDNIATTKECIVVEGEIDCLTFCEVGMFNCVSIPNGSTTRGVNLEYLDNCIEYFDNKETIYLGLDNDEAGQNVQKEFIRRLGAERCRIIDYQDCKDANEFFQKYGKDELKKLIDTAAELPIDGVSSVLDWGERFDEYICNGMQKGFVTGTSLDEIFSTYTGQYVVVTGMPSSGKSDFVDYLCMLYNARYGWKTAYASPENIPYVIHAGKLISKICGKWLTKEDINVDWYRMAKEFIHDNFKFIELESFGLEEVLAKAKALIRKFGIKVLVIDPYNKVRLKSSLDKNITEYTNDYLVRIDEFARVNDILIFLIAHPRKPNAGESNAYIPTFYDIKGGGEFYDMSPHGLLIHRDYEADVTMVKTLKVKFAHLGKNNKHVYMKWNENNGRYSDFKNQQDKPELCSLLQNDDSNWIINAIESEQTQSGWNNLRGDFEKKEIPF